MTPAEKSLEAVNDIVNIVQSVSIQGKDAGRVGSCLAYLGVLRDELEKEIKKQPHLAEVPVEQTPA